MRERGLSSAYADLDAVLRDRGYVISSTRIENWCYWRNHGLVDRPRKHGAGRGSRSVFEDLDRSAEQAIAVHEAVRPRASLDLVALRLVAGGRDLDPDDVKAAFVTVLDVYTTRFLRDAEPDEIDDTVARAHRAGWAVHNSFTHGRRARARKSAGVVSQPDGWVALGQLLLGQRPSRDKIVSLVHATGLSLLAAYLGKDPEAAVSGIQILAPALNFEMLQLMSSTTAPKNIIAGLRSAERFRKVIPPPSLTAMHNDDHIRLMIALLLLVVPIANASETTIAELLTS